MTDDSMVDFLASPVPQHIHLEELLNENETASGSYDLRGVRATTFGKLLQALPIPALLINRSYNIVFANKAWGKIGAEYGNILGAHFSALFPDPATVERAMNVVKDVFSSRKPQTTEAVLGMDQARTWGRVNLRCLRVGRDRHLLVLVEDLTYEKRQLLQNELYQQQLRHSRDQLERGNRELRRAIGQLEEAEEKLRLEKQKFQTLTEDSPIGMLMIHEDGTFQHINAKFKHLFGYDLSEIPNGRTWFRKAYPDAAYRREVIAAWLKDLADSPVGGLRSRTFTVTCKDGTHKFIQFRCVQLDTGQHLLTCEDVTDRKRAEELLLQDERKKAIGELAYGVAHNFNNLLQVIMGDADMALSGLQTGDRAAIVSYLEDIRSSARSGGEMVRRLQQFARRRPQEAPPGATVFDLCHTVDQAVELTRPWWETAPEKDGIKISLIRNLQSGCMVKGKESELSDVVVNLIKNAAEAVPIGGTIEVRVFGEEDKVILMVRDDGVGIREENLDKVFEPFWTTQGFQSAGMGLASSYGIVSRHGGRISVRSKEAEGSTFRVELPLAERPSARKAPVAEVSATRPLRMLVIDDMEPVVMTLKEILTQHGHTVLTALSGAEAVEIFKQNQLDIVLCDLGMPVMNGWEVGKALRLFSEERGIRKIPFVFITGWGDQLDEEERMAESGVDGVLAKPVNVPRLLEVVGALVPKR
ncbi:MAG: response regulator [Desulfomonile tiedjei]|nr:response regulator [Desulfomonile tiedjei]